MRGLGPFALVLLLMLSGCGALAERGTIAQLRHVRLAVEEEPIQDGLDQAMESYRRFLEETLDPVLTPEAIRRLADLKIEKEYGTLVAAAALAAVEQGAAPAAAAGAEPDASDAAFVQRATQTRSDVDALAAERVDMQPFGAEDDLERVGALEAIALYMRLLEEYPLYARNDQVLYQMARAYEELGRVPEAMAVMEQLAHDHPRSRYIDEVQFRRGEFYFAYRRYLDAEDAYQSVVDFGSTSAFFELALYKLGWTYYKQELYDDGLHRFVALLDHKVSQGFDFERIVDEQEHKRTEDTFRVISLSFSNLGGAESVVDYFTDHGHRAYEDRVYRNLAEFYLDKRRYADAAAAYNAFVRLYPFHRVAPGFHMRVIDIHTAGGFPSLVLEAKKAFANTYGRQAPYWDHFHPADRPEVLSFLKTNLVDLAHYYHAAYQDEAQAEHKADNLQEALHWYRQFLASFAADPDAPGIHHQLADLLLENQSYGAAAAEYERTAYDYPPHEQAPQAGFAAVYALRQHLAGAPADGQTAIKQEVVRSSIRFADTFPEHTEAAVVLGAAADDLYEMNAYEQALATAQKVLHTFAAASADVLRAAWRVTAHASFDLADFAAAEAAYLQVLTMLPEADEARPGLVDNLAAAIYKQGEQSVADGADRAAADHFLRVGRVAPTSTIRPNAEYDAAAALMRLEEWISAATVLEAFRKAFPDHDLQPDVTRHLAYVYRENKQHALAAEAYERIEQESEDDQIRQDALLLAAELHETAANPQSALAVYRRYVGYFPQPVDQNIEARHRIAEILKARGDQEAYLDELAGMVVLERAAGPARTPRTRHLGGYAALVLAEEQYARFTAVALVQPFEASLQRKRDLMRDASTHFDQLLDYQIGELTAAATYYLAEIYEHFSKALMTSERPGGLDPLEMEEYELAIEAQAYPFEEQAIAIHEKNQQLIQLGVYNHWIEMSLAKLVRLMPARYDKPETEGEWVTALETFVFAIEAVAPDPETNPETDPVEETHPAVDTNPATDTDLSAGVGAADDPITGAAADSAATVSSQLSDR